MMMPMTMAMIIMSENNSSATLNSKGLAKRSQHPATLLHDAATCVERGGQTHATFSSFSKQHVNVHVIQAPGAQEVDLTRMP